MEPLSAGETPWRKNEARLRETVRIGPYIRRDKRERSAPGARLPTVIMLNFYTNFIVLAGAGENPAPPHFRRRR
jgi:hypothetical protein